MTPTEYQKTSDIVLNILPFQYTPGKIGESISQGIHLCTYSKLTLASTRPLTIEPIEAESPATSTRISIIETEEHTPHGATDTSPSLDERISSCLQRSSACGLRGLCYCFFFWWRFVQFAARSLRFDIRSTSGRYVCLRVLHAMQPFRH